jgi:tetratricopeptide (TPR) repeat protein
MTKKARTNESHAMDPANALRKMESLMGGAAKGKSKRVQEAQDLVYQAWEAEDLHEAADLLHRATELDPTNLDAWLGLMELSILPAEEEIEMLRELLPVGEKALGKDFKECKGHFWGVLETRPYMRARARLAQLLMETGKVEDAIAEFEGMLELNPNDNQGIRYELIGAYLSQERWDGARRLFKKYDERTYTATWAWAYILERFMSGALDEAAAALADAQGQNPHMRAYVQGDRRLPKHMPDSYAMGSREEAMIAWDVLQPAWEKHPEAGQWLRAQPRAPVSPHAKNGQLEEPTRDE